MRCAYQRAVSGCTCAIESSHCPNCEKRFNKFYLGSENISLTGDVTGDGKAIYRVNSDVDLIYYPYPTAPFYQQVIPNDPTTPAEPLTHFVIADRDKNNHVVYRYLRTDGLITNPRDVPTAGTSLFKLGKSDIRSLSELDKLLTQIESDKNLMQSVRFRIGKKEYAAKDVRPLFEYDGNELLCPDEKASLKTMLESSNDDSDATSSKAEQNTSDNQGDAPSPLSGKMIMQYGSNLYLLDKMEKDEAILFLRSKSEQNKESLRVAVRLPQSLSASSDLKRLYVDNTTAEQARRSGRVNIACIDEHCWFKVGKYCDVPHGTPPAYVGHYGRTYVWVPACGRDQLTKLTLTILDIAANDAPSSPTSEVYAFIDKDGKTATTYDKAAYLAKATIQRGGSVAGMLPTSPTNAKPPTDGELKAHQNVRNEQRLRFKRAMVEAGLTIFDEVKKVGESVPTSVDYVSQNYISRTVEVLNGDLLVPLAAKILSSDGEKILNKVGDKHCNEQEVAAADLRANIVEAARDFLNAEALLQDLGGTPVAPEGPGIITPTASRDASEVGAAVLRSELDLRVLGGSQMLGAPR